MSKELLEYLANMIGEGKSTPSSQRPTNRLPGCTPKAISHRLTNIKNTGKPVQDNTTTPTKATQTAAKSAKATPAKTPGSGRGCGRPAKNLDVDGEPTDLHNSLSPSANRKRGRTVDATDDTGKKIKMEEITKEQDFGVEDEI
jgi:hypothetical protein